MDYQPVLTAGIEDPNSHKLDFYLKQGGYRSLEKVFKEYAPEKVIEFVKESELRGRGGAGFSAGMKWSFVPKDHPGPKYLAVNADESEPGTFKDIVIIENKPHLLLEGITICCYAVGIHKAFIYIRGEFVKGAQILEAAIEEAKANNYLGKNILNSGFDLEVIVHRGAGAYICGEETALLTSIEGGRGYPRNKPPFPAVIGAFGKPTVINNVETLACLPPLFERGLDWFKSIGRPKNTGPKLYCLSGHVNKPGVYEKPMGITLRELIYDIGGGVKDNRNILAIVPGGTSAPFLKPDSLDVKMDFDGVAEAGSMLGSAGVIVISDKVNIVDVALNVSRFYHHESCGQCVPCRYGTGWIEKILHRIYAGHGKVEDIDLIIDICNNMQGQTICPLADACAMPIRSIMQRFRPEIEAYIHSTVGSGSHV